VKGATTSANIGRQRRVIGGDGDVPMRGQFAAGDGADAEKKDDEQRHENRRKAEGAAADLFQVFAAGDEQHVTRQQARHRPYLPRSQ
jgi:hypothetical protein